MLFHLSILGLVTETLHTLGEFLNGPNLVSVIMTGFRDCPQSQRLLVLYQHCCNSINDRNSMGDYIYIYIYIYIYNSIERSPS